jgi:exodeoxyribonuclease VII large subunit
MPRPPGRLTVPTMVPQGRVGVPGPVGHAVAPDLYPGAVTLEDRARRLVRGPSGDAGTPDALSIAELYERVDRAVRSAFPDDVWITGEVRSMNVLRNGHCFLDLVDPTQGDDPGAPKLNAKCWAGTWRGVKASLDRLGIALEVGMVVRARGKVELYKARGSVDFILRELDSEALMGRVAADRARLVQALVDEDLYDRQRRLRAPVLPLRVGLVASQGTEGYHDFLGQLEASGLAFVVRHVQSAVQGSDAPVQLAGAIGALQDADVDVIAVVRGGGAKADLAAFDHELVARAVATADVPVWTGIGHTNDISVVDEVAQRSCITPTECGREVAGLVLSAWQRIEEAGLRVARLAAHGADREAVALAGRRRALSTCARAQLDRQDDRTTAVRAALGRSVSAAEVVARAALDARADRVGGAAVQALEAAELRADQYRRLLGAFDVTRQLERGWSVTRDPDGAVLRSVAGLERGTVLVTQLADGTLTSEVTASTAAPPTARPTQTGAS